MYILIYLIYTPYGVTRVRSCARTVLLSFERSVRTMKPITPTMCSASHKTPRHTRKRCGVFVFDETNLVTSPLCLGQMEAIIRAVGNGANHWTTTTGTLELRKKV